MSKGLDSVNRRYVLDEDGERVAILLDIEDYERIITQYHALAAEDEPLDPEEAELRITEFVASAEDLPGPLWRNSQIASPN